jgi:hypothetical protein
LQAGFPTPHLQKNKKAEQGAHLNSNMREDTLNKLLGVISFEERVIKDYKEIPCKDMDLDCFAFDGKIPFGSYEKCYNYAPELGRCIFCEWKRG